MAVTAQFAWYFPEESTNPFFIQNGSLGFNTHSLHYAGSVFEGIRKYPYDDKHYTIFRLESHIDRLIDSAKQYDLQDRPFSYDDIVEGCIGIAQLNADHDYIRPLIFRGRGIGIKSPTLADGKQSIGALIISEKWGKYLQNGKYNDGVKIGISTYRKTMSDQAPVTAKGSANYITSTIVKNEAEREGLAEKIILHPDGVHISEGTGMNIVLVDSDNNTLITPDATSNRLDGITLDTILTIARNELNMKIEQRNVSVEELLQSKECFFCGTAAEITPITMIEGKKVGKGWMSLHTKLLQYLYTKVVLGKLPKYHHWCTIVPKTFKPQSNYHRAGQYYNDI